MYVGVKIRIVYSHEHAFQVILDKTGKTEMGQ